MFILRYKIIGINLMINKLHMYQINKYFNIILVEKLILFNLIVDNLKYIIEGML